MGFKVKIEADRINIPLISGTPSNQLNKLISFIQQERLNGKSITEILRSTKPSISELMDITTAVKAAAFGSGELLPLNEILPQNINLYATAILTIIDLRTLMKTLRK